EEADDEHREHDARELAALELSHLSHPEQHARSLLAPHGAIPLFRNQLVAGVPEHHLALAVELHRDVHAVARPFSLGEAAGRAIGKRRADGGIAEGLEGNAHVALRAAWRLRQAFEAAGDAARGAPRRERERHEGRPHTIFLTTRSISSSNGIMVRSSGANGSATTTARVTTAR